MTDWREHAHRFMSYTDQELEDLHALREHLFGSANAESPSTDGEDTADTTADAESLRGLVAKLFGPPNTQEDNNV